MSRIFPIMLHILSILAYVSFAIQPYYFTIALPHLHMYLCITIFLLCYISSILPSSSFYKYFTFRFITFTIIQLCMFRNNHILSIFYHIQTLHVKYFTIFQMYYFKHFTIFQFYYISSILPYFALTIFEVFYHNPDILYHIIFYIQLYHILSIFHISFSLSHSSFTTISIFTIF